jgi:AAA domain
MSAIPFPGGAIDHVIIEMIGEANPPPDRNNLLVSEWLKRDLPPRDYLLGEVFSTTTRCLIIGETGIGKTLLSLDMAAAMAAGSYFIGWDGHRKVRVMYLDGEMPAETFKDRIGLIAKQYGGNIELYGYNRDVLGPDDLPPLNTAPGKEWLLREIETVRPDVIFFDSIMCLLVGSMGEEESWAPVKLLMREITSRRIAQFWLHHTGHDATRGFGTKTREWELDTIILLSRISDSADCVASTPFNLEFKKSRLKNPDNFLQFASKTVVYENGRFVSEGRGTAASIKTQSQTAIVRDAFKDAYGQLADGVQPSRGLDGNPVRKVKVDDIRDELKSRGFLDLTENGRLTSTSKSHFHRAKSELLAKRQYLEKEGRIWPL